MLVSETSGQSHTTWPETVLSALCRTTSERVEATGSSKRSMSVNTARRMQTAGPNASQRCLSPPPDSDREIKNVILSILALMEGVDRAEFVSHDSDDRSTCDSDSSYSKKSCKSNLVRLLVARLKEIRQMHLSKALSEGRAEERPATTDAKSEQLSVTVARSQVNPQQVDIDNAPSPKPQSLAPTVSDILGSVKQGNMYDGTFYKRPMVNVSFAKADMAVIEAATKKLRWKTCESSVGGDIFWFANCLEVSCSKDQMSIFSGITYNKAVINRFDNLHCATKKVPFACLADIYDRYSKSDPHLYSTAACPTTFIAPGGTSRMLKMLKSGVPMIIKPSSGSMGHGIKVVTSIDQVPSAVLRGNNNYVCQVYVELPMLIDARKFDFRMYVLITNIGGGFSAFLSTLGIVRVCTQPYQRPNKRNCNNPFMHLTNYSINRQHMMFQRSVHIEDDTSNKRDLRSALKSLQEAYGLEAQNLWSQMVTLSEAAVSILYPNVQIYTTDPKFHRFQIIGLDMLLDENAKMWLLEVNSNPSLHYTYQENHVVKPDIVDQHVKVSLVAESLKLIHRMRFGVTSENESSSWIELRVRIPPEIGITTALYAECMVKYGKQEMECDDWVHFCKTNGLVGLLRDSMEEHNQLSGIKKGVTLKDARILIRDTFARTRSRLPLEGFPGFLSHMESLASCTFRKHKSSSLTAASSNGNSHTPATGQRQASRDHHNVRSVACLRKLLEQVQFYTDFRDKDVV